MMKADTQGAATHPDSGSPAGELDGTEVYTELPDDRLDMSPGVRTHIKRPHQHPDSQFRTRVGGGWAYPGGDVHDAIRPQQARSAPQLPKSERPRTSAARTGGGYHYLASGVHARAPSVRPPP